MHRKHILSKLVNFYLYFNMTIKFRDMLNIKMFNYAYLTVGYSIIYLYKSKLGYKGIVI